MCSDSGAEVTADFEMQLMGAKSNILYKNRGITEGG
jgi:hypothetical protein